MRECSPPQTCHVSRVTSRVTTPVTSRVTSRVTCHVSRHASRVTCHVSHVICHNFFGQSGEAYRWRVFYQRGLPRLVIESISTSIGDDAEI